MEISSTGIMRYPLWNEVRFIRLKVESNPHPGRHPLMRLPALEERPARDNYRKNGLGVPPFRIVEKNSQITQPCFNFQGHLI
jgi:hypothetical protein